MSSTSDKHNRGRDDESEKKSWYAVRASRAACAASVQQEGIFARWFEMHRCVHDQGVLLCCAIAWPNGPQALLRCIWAAGSRLVAHMLSACRVHPIENSLAAEFSEAVDYKITVLISLAENLGDQSRVATA